MLWTHDDTIKMLRAARRTLGVVGYLEMFAWLAVMAIVLGFMEMAL